jgi:hypothetical protein
MKEAAAELAVAPGAVSQLVRVLEEVSVQHFSAAPIGRFSTTFFGTQVLVVAPAAPGTLQAQ